MAEYRKNKPITVQYRALHRQAGLSDLYIRIFNPFDVLVETALMTEVFFGSGIGEGHYEHTFTPTENGQWRVLITSNYNLDDISMIFEVGTISVQIGGIIKN